MKPNQNSFFPGAPFQDRTKQGSAIMVIMGLLALLSFMGVVFLMKTQANVRKGESHSKAVEATLTAKSGLEKAFSLINEEVKIKQSPVGGKGAGFFYGHNRPGTGTIRYQRDIPLRRAYWSSYSEARSPDHRLADENGNKSVRIRNVASSKIPQTSSGEKKNPPESDLKWGETYRQRFGIAGELPAETADSRSVFSLRIEDQAGKIYVNGPEKSPGDPDDFSLAKNQLLLLNNLGTILFENGELPFANLGNRINRARSEVQGNLKSFNHLTRTRPFEDHLPESKVLKHYLSFYAWKNETTLHPEALEPAGEHQFRLIRNKEQDRIHQPRAPVNVNSAPEEILVSMFWKLEAKMPDPEREAVSLTEAKLLDEPEREEIPPLKDGRVLVQKELARKIASRFVKRRSELIRKRGYGFENHREVRNLLYALDSNNDLDRLSPETEVKPIRSWGYLKRSRIQALQQLLVANVNPSAPIPHVNPNFAMKVRLGDVSKANLTKWTTELSFSPNGYFSVTSLGRILQETTGSGKGFKLIAQSDVRTTMKAYDRWKVASQEEFYRNRREDLSSTELRDGHFPAVSYPENLYNLQEFAEEADKIPAARYDGYVMLPTTDHHQKENDQSISYQYNLDPNPIGKQSNQGVTTIDPGNEGGRASELFPDGVFAGRASSGSSNRAGGSNVDAVIHKDMGERFQLKHGSISLWVKPYWFGNDPPEETSDHPIDGSRTLFMSNSYSSNVDYNPSKPHSHKQLISIFRMSLTSFIRYDQKTPRLFGTLHTPFEFEQVPVPGDSTGNGDGSAERTVLKEITESRAAARPLNLQHQPERNPYMTGKRPAKSWYYPGSWHHIVMEWKLPETGGTGQVKVEGEKRGVAKPPERVKKFLTALEEDFFDIDFQVAEPGSLLMRLWVDGVPDEEGWTPVVQTETAGRLSSIFDLMVGSMKVTDRMSVPGFPWPFEGTIDDVRIQDKGTWEQRVGKLPHRYKENGYYGIQMGPSGGSPVNEEMDEKTQVLCGTQNAYLPERLGAVETSVRLGISKKEREYDLTASSPGSYWIEESPEKDLTERGLPHYESERRIPLTIYLETEGSWIVESPIVSSVSLYVHTGGPEYFQYSVSE